MSSSNLRTSIDVKFRAWISSLEPTMAQDEFIKLTSNGKANAFQMPPDLAYLWIININRDKELLSYYRRLEKEEEIIIPFIHTRKKKVTDEVDCTNDLQMVGEKLRPPHLIIDREAFRHDPSDKDILKELKKDGVSFTNTLLKDKEHKVHAKIFKVQLENTEKSSTFETTKVYHNVSYSDIGRILAFYNKSGQKIVKAYKDGISFINN